MNHSKIHQVWKLLFVIYIGLLLFFVVIKPIGYVDRMQSILEHRSFGVWNYNVDPFRSVSSYFRFMSAPYAFINIFGNILAFCPLGFLIPIMFKTYKGFFKTIFLYLVSIVAIECFQFVTMSGYFDVDDVILNMAGCLIGYGVYIGFRVLTTTRIRS